MRKDRIKNPPIGQTSKDVKKWAKEASSYKDKDKDQDKDSK